MKTSHIVRIEEELFAIEEKLQKLEIFMAGEAFDSLALHEQAMLYDQSNIMQDYAKILKDRLFYYEDLSK